MSKRSSLACTGLVTLVVGFCAAAGASQAQQFNPGVGANVSTNAKDGGLLRRPVSRCIFFQGETRAKCESQERRSPEQRTQRNSRR